MSDVIPQMTKVRAEYLVSQINAKATEMRQMLAELHDLKGWQALGYGSWRECVTTEFGQSASQLYRELAAKRLEDELGVSPNGEIPEYTARLINAQPADARWEIYAMAKVVSGDSEPGTTEVKAAMRVRDEILATGGHVSAAGVSLPVQAALTEEVYETMQRQRQHISESQERKHGTQAASVGATFIEIANGEGLYYLSLRLTKFDAETLQGAIDAGANNIQVIARKKDTQ